MKLYHKQSDSSEVSRRIFSEDGGKLNKRNDENSERVIEVFS